MATTTVTRGAVEIAAREGSRLPQGWAVGRDGRSTDDPYGLLDDMLCLRGGGLLPLGGEGEAGYKGYGLAVMVDILCALTSGGLFGADVRDTEETSARVCRFFMAMDIAMFRDIEDFKRDISLMLGRLRSMEAAEGASRVYYAGLKAHENEAESNLKGVPLSEDVWQSLLHAQVLCETHR
jgi:LDH2 family malate/lactate/ureidoglycolate dehydrogenase